MPALDYSYIPSYGVEPYEDTEAGGAKVTGDNLLISLWTVEDKDGEPPAAAVTIGEIVRPAEVDTNQLENIRPGYPNAMHSRSSAEFYFGPSEDFVWPLLAVLNPPDELKQQLANTVEYTGGDASDPTNLENYAVSKSLQGCYAWLAEMLTASTGAMNRVSVAECEFGYSTYLPLTPVGITLDFQLPFLRTNGADGVVPEFFDMSTVAGVRTMINAINRGQFYVGLLLMSETAENGTFARIRWPHSTARG